MLFIPPEIEFIIDRLENNGFEAYLVGGCVRDMLMGISPHDYDITTSAPPEIILTLFEKTVPTGIKHTQRRFAPHGPDDTAAMHRRAENGAQHIAYSGFSVGPGHGDKTHTVSCRRELIPGAPKPRKRRSGVFCVYYRYSRGSVRALILSYYRRRAGGTYLVYIAV